MNHVKCYVICTSAESIEALTEAIRKAFAPHMPSVILGYTAEKLEDIDLSSESGDVVVIDTESNILLDKRFAQNNSKLSKLCMTILPPLDLDFEGMRYQEFDRPPKAYPKFIDNKQYKPNKTYNEKGINHQIFSGRKCNRKIRSLGSRRSSKLGRD